MTLAAEMSDVQRDSFARSNARTNIWHGPVRSGKTVATVLRWLDYVDRQAPPGDLFILGKTQHALVRNIIGPMREFLGSDLVWSPSSGMLRFWGRDHWVIGANDARAEEKIRGCTAAGVLGDEVTLWPRSFWQMQLSRTSIPGAKGFFTTNPDSPSHWLKRDFIDRAHELDLAAFHWGLRDNPYLEEAFVNALCLEYTGLWHKRYIEGIWALAEGAIYDSWNESIHVRPRPDMIPDEYIIGVDFATSSPTAYEMVAIKHLPGGVPRAWVDAEYYYDPARSMRQRSCEELAGDMLAFQTRRRYPVTPVTGVYVDPSAAALELDFARVGIAVSHANNEVSPGIQTVTRLLRSGMFTIAPECVELVREFPGYVWDPKRSMLGIDEPIKAEDHALDALRYALHSRGLGGASPLDLLTPTYGR